MLHSTYFEWYLGLLIFNGVMIRRKRIQTRQERIESGGVARENCQRRKESTGRVSRFNYAIDSIPSEEAYEHSHSRGRRYQEYHIPSGENEPSLNNKQLHHLPTRLLKKDYLYDGSIDRQDCKHILGTANLNTSYDLNRSGNPLGEMEYKNCSFESMANTRNYSISGQNSYLSGNYLKRTAIFADNPHPYLDISTQSLQKSRNHLEKTKTEEDLQAKYQQIYANNQREKQKSTINQSISIPHSSNFNKETVIINARPLINRKNPTHREQSLSKGKAELSSGSNTQRNVNESSSKKVILTRGLQTRKTSPTRIEERAKQLSELITLRSSPVRTSPSKIQLNSNLKLIDDFSQRVSCKIEELTATLHSLRTAR